MSSRHGRGRYDFPPSDAIAPLALALAAAESHTHSSSTLLRAMLMVRLSLAEIGSMHSAGLSLAGSHALSKAFAHALT